MLVAPMFEPEGSRDIYLPEGGWYDYWSDQHFKGRQWIRYQADLERLPFFVRAGGVIPEGPLLQHADERPWHPLTFDVYPKALETREFRVSDGKSTIDLRLAAEENGLLLEGSKLDYIAQVRVHLAPGKTLFGHLGEQIRYD